MIDFSEAAFSAYLQGTVHAPFVRELAVFGARGLILGVLVASGAAAYYEQDPRTRHGWREVGWAVGGAACLSLALALLIGRERPFQQVADLVMAWIPAPASLHSFPSTHTAAAWAWASGVSWIYRPYAWLWILVALAISISRVFVGVHFVSDVVGGIVVGVGAFFLVRVGHSLTEAVIRRV